MLLHLHANHQMQVFLASLCPRFNNPIRSTNIKAFVGDSQGPDTLVRDMSLDVIGLYRNVHYRESSYHLLVSFLVFNFNDPNSIFAWFSLLSATVIGVLLAAFRKLLPVEEPPNPSMATELVICLDLPTVHNEYNCTADI